MPFGLPVEPDVYKTKRGCSLSSSTAGQSAEASFISSCHQTSRPGFISIDVLQRLKTMHFSTVGDLARAASTFCFKGTILPRRQPPSAVMISFDLASLLRSATASEE